jgi:enterochelin esterase-like enzyme
MKNKIMALVLVTTMILSSFVSGAKEVNLLSTESTESTIVNQSYGDNHRYKVYLPENYDPNTNYPSIYLMPKDGFLSQEYIDDGIEAHFEQIMASDQSLDIIIIMPEYNIDDNFTELMTSLVADVELKYSVIKDASYRGVLGVGVGGYMAYAMALLDAEAGALFTAVGSHMGNFTDNNWTSNGSVYEAAMEINPTVMKSKYYYMDAPNGAKMTTEVGSTSDIASILMQKSNPYYGTQWASYATPNTDYVEYSIRDGQADKTFYLESLKRSLNRFSIHFTKGLITGELSLKPQAVTSSDNVIDASIEILLSDVITNYKEAIPPIEINVSMVEPNTKEVLYITSTTIEYDDLYVPETTTSGAITTTSGAITYNALEIGESFTKHFELDRSNMASGTNTDVVVEARILGMVFNLSKQSLVNVQETGTADDEQLVDLMGNWYFNAYKDYKANDTETVPLDYIINIDKTMYEEWDVVQPGMGWWTADFASSLASETSATYAWYIREFDLPNDFSRDGLLLAVGKVDEAIEVFVNGIRVGSTGYDYTKAEVGVYDGTNPWDVNSVYEIDTSILNYGGTNTIAARICNSSGGGGWYEGPIGLYSRAAYNKVLGKPSIYASDSVTDKVITLVEKQKEAIQTEEIDRYKATLSFDFFDSGYDKERKVNEVQGWMQEYTDIKIADNEGAVFIDGNLFDYVAQRVITGKDVTGTQQTIFEGEINQYYKVTDSSVLEYGNHSRFYVDSYVTDAINGIEQTLTARVYLPEGYFEGQKRYKTSYLFHGINSSSKTFEIDNIDKVLDENIADGKYEAMIVVLPDDPTKTSFWRGDYADMITEDLIPTIDARYRTVNDARYRFTAGCSMGGAGSFGIGLTNPNLFSGVVSFYGALTTNDILPNTLESSQEYLSEYAIFMASGNQDNYNFYDIAGEMSRVLNNKGVNHYLYIDNGGHNTEFYRPLFDDAYSYMEDNMYQVEVDGSVIDGDISLVEKNSILEIEYVLSVDEDISDYLDVIEDSKYTTETNPDITIPMTVAIEQNNNVIYTTTQYFATKVAKQWSGTLSINDSDFDINEKYTVKVYASVLDHTKLISEQVVLADNSSSSESNNSTNTPNQTREVRISNGQILDAVGKSNEIVISIDLPKSEESVEVKLDKDSLEKMIDAKTKTFTVQTLIGTITLDANALATIDMKAKGEITLSINKVDVSSLTPLQRSNINANAVYNLTIASDDGIISDFETGVVTVEVPYISETIEDKDNIVVYYIDVNGNTVLMPKCIYDDKEQIVRFNTTHFSTFVVANNRVSFNDVEKHWANEEINFTASREIFKGTGEGKFSPDMSMTRGMFVTAVSRLAGANLTENTNQSPFEDVNVDAYYAKAIAWASQKEIIKGIDSNTFAPDQEITRGQMAAILYNYSKVMNDDLESINVNKTFTDNEKLPDWSKEAINKMQEAAIIEGKPGNLFDHEGKATRAEVSTVIKRYIENVLKE